MPVFLSTTNAIASEKKGVEKLLEMSWKEIDKKGFLEELKSKDYEGFKAKFKEEFKKDYTGKEA